MAPHTSTEMLRDENCEYEFFFAKALTSASETLQLEPNSKQVLWKTDWQFNMQKAREKRMSKRGTLVVVVSESLNEDY